MRVRTTSSGRAPASASAPTMISRQRRACSYAPAGATVRHLLAHASGLPFVGEVPIAKPGRRRIYSNTGFEQLADAVGQAAEMPFADYLRLAVFEPLEMRAELRGSAAAGVHGTLDDLITLARELQSPTLVAPETLAEATSVQFPGLGG